MKTKSILAALSLFLTLSACNSSQAGTTNSITSNRLTGTFYGIIINANANVILKQGETPSVRLEGDRSLVEQTKTTVENGALVISGTSGRSVTVYVTIGELNLLEINGNARLTSDQVIFSDILLLKINGNGTMNLDVRSLTLGMIVKGKGRIVISGSTGDSFARVYGSGKIQATGLDAFHFTEEVHSGEIAFGNEQVRATKRATLNLHQ